MKCKVTTVILGDVGLSYDLGDEVTVVAGEAQAFSKGVPVSTLVNAQVVVLGDRYVSIEGFAHLGHEKYERRQWWCEVGAEKP